MAIVLFGAVGSQPMKTLFEVVVTVSLLFVSLVYWVSNPPTSNMANCHLTIQFLAMTTQMIVGGEGRLWVMPTTRYVRAALALYSEIMVLYFYMPAVRLVK